MIAVAYVVVAAVMYWVASRQSGPCIQPDCPDMHSAVTRPMAAFLAALWPISAPLVLGIQAVAKVREARADERIPA